MSTAGLRDTERPRVAARLLAGVVDVVDETGRAALGRYGEDLAAQHLQASGAVLLDRNWRCRQGELDIVALEADGTLVFCEVKTRSSTSFGEPAEAVGAVKARRIRGLACRWLEQHRPRDAAGLRFDVIAIVRERGSTPRVRHLRNAF